MLVLSCSVVGGIRVVKVAADGGQRPKSGKGDTEGPTPAPATCLNVAGEYTRGPEASDWVSFTQSGCSGVLSLDLGTFEFTVSGNEISAPDVGLTGEISAGPPYTITWSNGAIYTPGRATQGPAPAPTCLNVAGEYTRGPEASDWVAMEQSGCSGVLNLDLGTFEFTVSGNEISVPDVGFTGEISAGPPYTITWSNGAIYAPGRATQDTEGPTPAPAPTRPAPTPPVPTPPAPTPPGYTFACLQPGCWCPTGFALQGTMCV